VIINKFWGEDMFKEISIDWEELRKSLHIQELNSEQKILETFFEEFKKLKEARAKGLISKEEFLRGLSELLKGFAVFEFLSEKLSDKELKFHLALLRTVLTTINNLLRDKLKEIKISLEEYFNKPTDEIKRKWVKFTYEVAELSKELANIETSKDILNLLIPLLTALIQYTICILGNVVDEEQNEKCEINLL